MLLYSKLTTTMARAGVVAIAALVAAVATADTFQFPLTSNSILSYNRSSVSATNYAQIQTGQNHTIARDASGNVYTWGDSNASGQLGRTGTAAVLATPTAVTAFQNTAGTAVAPTPTIVDIAAGDTFSVALDSNGNVYYTGAISGQTQRTVFRQITNPGSPTAYVGKDIAAGGGHIVGVFLKTAGTKHYVYAMGNNSDGQCAVATSTNPVTTWAETTQFSATSAQPKAIAAGSAHSLVVQGDGRVWAFGDNASGQLANGTTTDSSAPVNCKDSVGTVISTTGANVSAGFDSSLLLTTTGTVLSAGGNSNGQLGRTSGSPSNFIAVANNLTNITSVSTGYKHAFAVDSTGNLYRWGFMVRASDLAESVTTPTLTPGFTGISVIHAGRRVINTAATDFTNLIDTTGGYNAIASTGTTPLFKRRYTLNGSGNVVQFLTGGEAGFARIEVDQAVTGSNMAFTFSNASAQLGIPGSANITVGNTFVDVPITTTAVSGRTTATFTVTQTAGWVLANRPIQLRAPAAVSVTAVNNDGAFTVIKAGQALVTVTLNYPAPSSGDYTMNVASANTGLIPNSTVTFAAGATTATTLVNVSAVATATGVKLSVANDGIKTAATTARIIPPKMTSVTLSLTPVVGGAAPILTIVLDSAAPSSYTPSFTFTDFGGTPIVGVASTVGGTFTASGTILDVTIDTNTVATKTVVYINTTLSGVTKRTRLVVNP